MIYVTSDIHGNLDRYKKLKNELITNDDQLYIIGDVLDRGPCGFDILDDIMNSPNVELLYGNHELAHAMIYYHTKQYEATHLPEEKKQIMRWKSYILEPIAGGLTTQKELKNMTKEKKELYMEYLLSLKYTKVIDMNGRKFVLSHGSIASNKIAGVTDRIDMTLLHVPLIVGDTIKDVVSFKIAKNINSVGEALEFKNTLDDLASRGYCTNAICVVGHTPTCYLYCKEKAMTVLKIGNNINIDCGCRGFNPNREFPGGHTGRLACLRLDDGKTFYFD